MVDEVKKHQKYISEMVSAGLLSGCDCNICQPKVAPSKVDYSALGSQIKKRLAQLSGTLPSEEAITS